MSAMLQHNDPFRYGPECHAEPVAVGIKQVLLGSAEQMVQSKTWYQRGSELTVRSDELTRTNYILEGFFEVSVAGQSQILGPSGSFVVPIGASYTVCCLEDGVLLTTQSAHASAVDRPSQNTQRCPQKERERATLPVSIRSKTFD